jgi:hypothetical protein
LVARRTEEAIDAILERTRHTSACVTNQPVVRMSVHQPTHQYEVRFAPLGEPVRLRSEDHRRRIFFDFMSSLAVQQPDDQRESIAARIVSYEYRILDLDAREILAFHWHPAGYSNVIDPHLHLSGKLNPIDTGRGQEPLPLAPMHIPNGFVTLEDVVRLLITEFGITPRRDDWDDLLRENRAAALAKQAG